MQKILIGRVLRRSVAAGAAVATLAAFSVAADDRQEIEFARSVVKSKLETERTGTGIDWTNPDTGKTGTLRVVETKIVGRGMPCRWYEWSIKVDAATKIETKGKGCRLAKDNWLLEETAIVRKTVKVKVKVKPKAKAKPPPPPEPKDPMAGLKLTRPKSMAGVVEPAAERPAGDPARATQQKD